MSSRPVRIAGVSGSASDRRHAIADFARNYPLDPVDVIIADFMSEANMAAAAGRRDDQDQAQSTPAGASIAPGYEQSFLIALQPALEDLAKHRIKLAVNAGNTDTRGLYEVVTRMIHEKGLDLKVAWVSGDEVLGTVKSALSSGNSTFKNIYTNEILSDWSFEPIFAQCYLGGLGIAAALSEGADIVLCGRVSDASPVIGAAYWYHNWQRSNLDQLANAFIAGHLIECSNYVCGGNFTGFKDLEHIGEHGWSNIGYPIAEISAQGQVVITMQKNAPGGAVTVDTCTSQLLYEIQGPYYLNSDVTAILTDIHFEQLSTNRVALHGVRSAPPPPTTKVGITARGGHQAEASWYLVGLDIDSKARMLEAQIRRLLAPYSAKYTSLQFSTLGSAPDNPKDQNSATVTFRIIVQARKAADIAPNAFIRHITDNIMQGYPGATFHLDLRLGFPKPIFEYYVTLLSQSDIQHRVHLPFLNNKTIDIPPPPISETETFRIPDRQVGDGVEVFHPRAQHAPRPPLALTRTPASKSHSPAASVPIPTPLPSFPANSKSTSSGDGASSGNVKFKPEFVSSESDSVTSFGPTTRGPLGWLVHARSGNKGPDANCGFWVRREDEYTWLRAVLSCENVVELLGGEVEVGRNPTSSSTSTTHSNLEHGGRVRPELSIERFELPNLRAVHFLFRNLLDRGVSCTTTVDFLGKNVAEFLRARWVDLPVRFLNRGKL